MRALTEEEARESFVNAAEDERRIVAMPVDFLLTDWDHLDFLAWRDPRTRGRGYLVTERDVEPLGVVLRASAGSSLPRSAMANLCPPLPPGPPVSMFTARTANR